MKIIIIGAGPVGCFFGYLAAAKGHDVTILETKKEIGIPLQCTGIMTKSIFNALDIEGPDITKEFSQKMIMAQMKSMVVHSANKSVEIPNDDIVIDRVGFDRYLSELAQKSGAKIHINMHVRKIWTNSIDVYDKSKKIRKNFKFDILVGADGPNSIAYEHLNHRKDNRPSHAKFDIRDYYLAKQFRVRGNFDKEKYHVFFGDIAPGFFAWIVPESDKVARIGIGGKSPIDINKSLNTFINFLKKEKIIEKDKSKILDSQGGLIPLFDRGIKVQKINKIKITSERNCLTHIYLVGDAAGMVKATTGGGIIQGLTSAKILCKAITEKKDYDALLRKELYGDLSMSLTIRKYMDRFSEKDYDDLLSSIDQEDIKHMLKHTTRDHPKKLAIKLLSKPKLLRLFISNLMKFHD